MDDYDHWIPENEKEKFLDKSGQRKQSDATFFVLRRPKVCRKNTEIWKKKYIYMTEECYQCL